MPERFSPAQPNYLRFVSTPTIDIEPEKSIRPSAPPTDTGGAFFGLLKKPRRVCAAHGANKVKIIFSGGKWVRLQERKARLVNKRESKSLILLLELIQRSRTHAVHTSGKILLALQVG